MSKTLIIRHSRIGDALIPVPLIYSLAKKYPQDQFTVLSNNRFAPIFDAMPGNVTFIPMIGKGSGFLRGPRFILKRIFFLKKLKRMSFDKVAMLQFETFEKDLYKEYKKTARIAITDEANFRDNKRLKELNAGGLTMVGLHKETFVNLGYTEIELDFDSEPIKKGDLKTLSETLGLDPTKKIIAIAPFSKEKQKVYPLDKMKEVAGYFSNDNNTQVLIFGGGQKEKDIVEDWRRDYPQIISTINKLSFADELLLISHCDALLSMDSANLHIANLLNTPVISVWGATAPTNGYYTPNENAHYEVIMKGVDCQPCSVFGSLPCNQDEYMRCMKIDKNVIIDKVKSIIK